MNHICCLNPTNECDNPQVPENTNYCPTCGTPLVILKNRYQPVKRLGGGGFAKTYLALDTDNLDERCVIKQLAPCLGNQTTQALIKVTELFLQEAQQLQKLAEHTQIPSLFAYFEENRQLYLVEQFVDGKNLLEELQTEGVFNEAKIRQFLQDLLLILQEVHNQGIIHRDIKPENIMRRHKDGKLVLIDFGASKKLQEGATAGTRIGTDGYAPWEQIVGGVASTAGDLYSLGVTCFYLLTSKNPYELWVKDGYNWVANWRNYLNQPLSQKLQQILDKLLVASSENHYGLADKVLEELRQPYTFIPSNSPKTIVSQNKKPFAKILCFTNGAVRSKITKRNFLLGAGIAVLILIYYYYYRDKTITPSIPIPFITSGCPKQTDDFISEGEEILNNSKPFDKTEGAKHFAKCNYQEALAKFKEAWQSDKLEPETLIYLNNALLKARKKQYYTIAIAVSISKNQDDSDSRAKEMLRGVAQLQTKINLGILDEGDPYIKYLGQNFGREKATNSKGIELKGKGLKVVITNDENEESKAKQRANSVSQRPEILGVVGHYASEMTLATVDIYGGKDLALISPGSTTTEVTNYPRENFFRTVFSVKQQSRYIAEFLRKKSIRKVVIFYSEGSPFSDSFYKTFKSYFETDPVNGSGSVIRLDEFDLGNDFDEKQAIQELRKKEQEIGILLVPKAVSNAQNDAIKLTKEINNRQNWIIGSWGLFSPNTLKQIDNPRPFQNFVISVPWHALTSPNQDFLMDAQNLWGTTSVNSVTALSYDATLALIKALEKENNPTRINIREHLKATDFKVDEGATGIIEFDSNGDRKNLSGEFVHIVECRTNNLGFAFVPIKYSTAKDANLPCSNSTKQ